MIEMVAADISSNFMIICDKGHATCDKQQVTSDTQHSNMWLRLRLYLTRDEWKGTFNFQHLTKKWDYIQQARCEKQQATSDKQQVTSDKQ